MRNFTTWGTEVEIFALEQISGFDIILFTQHKQWICYLHCVTETEYDKNQCAFFMSNESGSHFNPVFSSM